MNTREQNVTKAKLKQRIQQIYESIERYLHLIASTDRRVTIGTVNRSERLKQ